VALAIDPWAVGRGDLADYLIGIRNEGAGCQATLTFDKALAGEPGFAAL
jgi:predicted nucleic-acid-binding protein